MEWKYMRGLGIALVAALALGLAGCGSDGGPSQADLDAANDKAKQQENMVTQLQGQINALRQQLGLPADGNIGDSIEDLQDEVERLEGQIVKQDENKAAKTGENLFAALAGTQAVGSDDALANITSVTLSATGLAVDAAANAGTLTTNPDSVTLEAGASAGSLDGWAGMNYAHTNAGTKVMNEAVVYSNKGPGRSRSFADLGYVIATADTADDFKGYVTLNESDAATLGRIKGTAFTHSGTQIHPYDAADGKFETRGEYDGAMGVYRCSGATPATSCTSTNDGKGSPSGLGGVWHFKPDAGTNAMAHQPDANYLYYGWWVSKDKDDMPTAASAFTGIVGSIQGDGTTALASNPATEIAGSAMYSGHAAGKFALDYSKDKLIAGASDGGHFTADVELTAKFGSNDAPNNGGVSGTIDNFMANGESVDWSVALHRAPWDSATAGMFATPADDAATANVDESMGTTWSIDGVSAPRSGTWSGQMYDEATTGPNDDGSDVPTTTTGTFYSTFDVVGRMVGAFGANKQ